MAKRGSKGVTTVRIAPRRARNVPARVVLMIDDAAEGNGAKPAAIMFSTNQADPPWSMSPREPVGAWLNDGWYVVNASPWGDKGIALVLEREGAVTLERSSQVT